MPAEPDAAVRSVRPLPPQLLANRLGRFFFFCSSPPPPPPLFFPCLPVALTSAKGSARRRQLLRGTVRAVRYPGCCVRPRAGMWLPRAAGGAAGSEHPIPIPSPSTSSFPSPSHRAEPEASPEATGAVRRGGEGPGCSGAVSVLLAGVPHLMLTPPWDVGTGAGPEGAPQGHTWARRGEEEAGSFCRDNRILDVLFPRLNGPKPPKPCRCHWGCCHWENGGVQNNVSFIAVSK